jgi:hypothetical protein
MPTHPLGVELGLLDGGGGVGAGCYRVWERAHQHDLAEEVELPAWKIVRTTKATIH